MNIQPLINAFFAQKGTSIQIYNEISLQIELGIFLRKQGFTVQFERPVQRYTDVSHSFRSCLNLFIISCKSVG